MVWLLLIGLAAGLTTGRDYGLSVDEQTNADVGADALAVYQGATRYFDRPSLDEHGPAYFMLFSATSTAFHGLFPDWSVADGRHLTNFVVFLLAVSAFYFLAARMVGREAAWAASALFATQPLLYGQGFIDQKDTPFLALFTLSIVVGMAAADRVGIGVAGPPIQTGSTQDLRARPQTSPKGVGAWVWKGLLLALGGLSLDLVIFGGLKSVVWGLITSAYAKDAPAVVQALFDRIATDAYKTPLSLYFDKFEVAWFSLQILVLPVVAATGLVIWSWANPLRARAGGWSWDRVRRFRISRWLILGGTVLGLTICVRQLGLFAGLLVSGYMVYRQRASALIPLAAYWCLAAVTTLATWPYLWPSPIARFMQSLYLGSHFPDTHVTFFRGAWLQAGHYPWYFFPNLAGIELTEPAVLLAVAGLGLSVLLFLRQTRLRADLAVMAAWTAVPLVGLVGFGMTTYGNITHLLFILPPFFVAAAVSLMWVFEHAGARALRLVLILGCVAPGVWGIAQLHPYEYIYINSFAGGVGGAYNFYELDRACLSLREGMEFVNQMAAPNATVMLPSDYHQVIPIARKDIHLVDNRTSYNKADFVLSCMWVHGLGPWPQQDFRLVDEVQRQGAVLTEVWQRRASTTPGSD